MEIYNFDAALFTRMVAIGEKDPDGEAAYEGYSRVRFAASATQSLEAIEFPEAKNDYRDDNGDMIAVLCVAAIDHTGTVIGIQAL